MKSLIDQLQEYLPRNVNVTGITVHVRRPTDGRDVEVRMTDELIENADWGPYFARKATAKLEAAAGRGVVAEAR